MKNLRTFFAVTLLIVTLGLPVYADGGMETPKTPPTGPSTSSLAAPSTPEGGGMDTPQAKNGGMETPLMITLSLIENLLALI